MQVAKWGNSLAVRLPAAVVDALNSRKAMRSKFMSPGPRVRHRAQAWPRRTAEAPSHLPWPAPADFKFDRDDANAR